MKIWKLLALVWVILMLVACTGKTVRAVGPPLADSTQGSTEITQTKTTEFTSDTLPTETQSDVVLTPESVVTEVPTEFIETATNESMPVVGVEEPASTEGEAVVVIESENAYTDAEKAELLKEIDLLLDETLKDLNSGEALDEWDENTGGGQ